MNRSRTLTILVLFCMAIIFLLAARANARTFTNSVDRFVVRQ